MSTAFKKISIQKYFARQADGNWLFQEVKELAVSFSLPSLGVSLPLAEIYRNVQLGESV